jgi:uncharacterized membrane protein YphA (DoxX/SURF4 family)
LQRITLNPWLELGVRWALGLTFIYASLHKIVLPAHFAKIIYGYDLLPGASINLIAIILPFLELFAGLALLLGVYPRSAAAIITGMLLAFMIGITINLIRGHEFDCGCFAFGIQGSASSAAQLLGRDVILLIFALHVLRFNGRRTWCALSSLQPSR